MEYGQVAAWGRNGKGQRKVENICLWKEAIIGLRIRAKSSQMQKSSKENRRRQIGDSKYAQNFQIGRAHV